MTSNGNDRPVLFLANVTADGLDSSDVTFDGSEEAMQRLRHPFAVKPARPTAMAGDNPDQLD
ncbi:hypothetical protein [Micromonospora cremea]|uniref:Uncharacterized protein n=1 Tax=Micromonospora cremea TaxID=709881 RepID=A0A1N6ADG2_9ACTN|nr:hypothetical protein [Micromonospora cremea]SIN32040.1 hypothetical protein SAMN04489832_5331 [Micromonospora cremea]